MQEYFRDRSKVQNLVQLFDPFVRAFDGLAGERVSMRVRHKISYEVWICIKSFLMLAFLCRLIWNVLMGETLWVFSVIGGSPSKSSPSPPFLRAVLNQLPVIYYAILTPYVLQILSHIWILSDQWDIQLLHLHLLFLRETHNLEFGSPKRYCIWNIYPESLSLALNLIASLYSPKE